ncbi:unnamed protein product [Medioppia subpectinata]|uniref:Peptidase S54 rhomboid domain-containing protein n=1 Tax=Medioppia subpectinata TaxID=1979941 RepID=A0A7R9KG58_9ACAR|nr:unnamed protein product [Medioppia subpectinata]CAG2101730.1 unnamed protein product [Medioppia subpectinata]
MNRNRGQSRVPSFAILLLANELMRAVADNGVPTVTLVTIISQILIFLHIIPLPFGNVWDVCLSYRSIVDHKEYSRLPFGNVWDVCLSYRSIVDHKEYSRVILSQLTHGDDWHLYYNMVSFLWKGRSLERRLGSIRFAITLIVFTISTAFTYVLVNKLIAETTEDYSYLNHCSVGFSGVIFALKVLTTHFDESRISYLMGYIPIGSKYAVWGELLPFGNVWDVCLSYRSIVDHKEYSRVILSQLTHGDDWHLYYNMVSFLWKGRSLERRLGSIRFAITLIVFTISTAFTYVLVNKLIAETTEDYSYLNHCSVGFSGVIFALKVLTTHFDESRISYLMGYIPIGSKYAVWGELVIIQLISPNASFVGHLSGILVGLAYIYGPLSYPIEIIAGIVNPLFGGFIPHSSNNYRNYRRYDDRSGRSGHRPNRPHYESYVPNDMSEEEQLRRAYEQSLNDNRNSRPTAQPTAPPYPTENSYNYPQNPSDAERLRQLRLRRYQQNS